LCYFFILFEGLTLIEKSIGGDVNGIEEREFEFEHVRMLKNLGASMLIFWYKLLIDLFTKKY